MLRHRRTYFLLNCHAPLALARNDRGFSSFVIANVVTQSSLFNVARSAHIIVIAAEHQRRRMLFALYSLLSLYVGLL